VKITFLVVELSLSMLESICKLFGAIPTLVAFSLTATLLFRYPLAPHIFEIFPYVGCSNLHVGWSIQRRSRLMVAS